MHYKRYLYFTLILIGAVIFSFFLSIEFLLNFANDDSFFYIKTAYNFSSGSGSTFDTINLTNGYHPLWFLLLSLMYYILNYFLNFTPELYFRFTVLLISTINIITIYFIFRYFETVYGKIGSRYFLLSVPLYLTLVAIRDFGMETHLLCLLVTIYIYLKSAELKSGSDFIRLKAILLILLFLTRIDFLFNVIPLIIITDYYTGSNKTRKRFLLYSAILLPAAAGIYFFSNYYFFGSFNTITALIKSSFPEIIFYKNFTDLFAPGTFTNQFIKSFFCCTVVLIFLLFTLRKKYRERFSMSDYFLFGICFSTIVFIFFNLFFNYYTLKEWYVAFPSYVCALLMIRMISLYPRIYYISMAMFLILFTYYFIRTRLENYKWNSMYYYALDLKNNVNGTDRIFMIDLSGIVGYFSEKKVINGDGLVNNFEYWKMKNEGRLKEYFDKMNIKYYSTYSTRKGNHEMKDSSGYLIDKCYSNKFGGYHFTFPKEDLVLKSDYYYSHAVNSDTGFWYLFKIK